MVLSLYSSQSSSFYLAFGLGKHCRTEQKEKERERCFYFYFLISLKNANNLEGYLLDLLLEITSGAFNLIALVGISEGAQLPVICTEASHEVLLLARCSCPGSACPPWLPSAKALQQNCSKTADVLLFCLEIYSLE